MCQVKSDLKIKFQIEFMKLHFINSTQNRGAYILLYLFTHNDKLLMYGVADLNTGPIHVPVFELLEC